METMEVSAKTVEEAIQLALEQLGVSREEVEVNVISEGKSGVMGLGEEDAVVQVQLLASEPGEDREDDLIEIAKGVLEKLIAMLGMDGSVELKDPPFVEPEKRARSLISFDIKCDDPGVLIGRRGQALACLQYIVRLIVSHHVKLQVPIIVDIEGYKERRYHSLQTLARHMAEQVKAKEAPFALEPMPAYERRIIHLALVDHPDVTTQSIGQGDFRKVVILPKEQEE